MIRAGTAILLIAAAVTPPLWSQQGQAPKTEPATFEMPEEYRAVQLSAIETQRRLLLSMADSMPERLYRDKATPAQRDFAQQLHHIAASGAFIASRFLGAPSRSVQTDTAQVFNSRAGLKGFINREYDYLKGYMTSQTAASRNERVQFFNGQMLPRWQLWDELNQHAMWTAGQVVANFRKNGMAPPPFLFF
jgi:hypothetical protein